MASTMTLVPSANTSNFDTPLPTFSHDDEITQLRDSFGIMQ